MSDYFKQLSKNAKRRYEEKLSEIGIENVEKGDPFLCSDEWMDDVTKWPEVDFGQIYVYLIDSPGPYTRETMKVYRSLDAFQQFYYGWVRTCYFKEVNNAYLLKAKVTRSQAVTETPHEAWCALDKKDASVITAHCRCMAGQGEMCTHVASLLFKIEACTRLGFNRVACTSLPCEWNRTFMKKIEATTVQHISFRKPKHQSFHQQLQDIPRTPAVQFADTTSFLEKLRKSNNSAVIFSVTNPKPQPKLSGPSLPPVLTHLYSTDNCILSAEELEMKCKDVFPKINVTQEQANKLETMTRQQSNCSLWFQFRKGRLTASNFHAIVHTNTQVCSSTSLLKKVMHYNARVSTCATDWGLKHEDDAIEQYKQNMMKDHANFKIRKCGLIVNDKYPYLAASPDAMISCDCCGSGVVEVKCPFTYRDSEPCEIDDQEFFLEKHSCVMPLCTPSLKLSHKHYAQVQAQISLADVTFCDFVCWTTKGVHAERIQADRPFFENMLESLKAYFVNIVLPELLTNRLKSEIESSKVATSYCFCGKPEDYDDMIACDSKICPNEWYHLSCVGLKESPVGKWFCLTCRDAKGGKWKKFKK